MNTKQKTKKERDKPAQRYRPAPCYSRGYSTGLERWLSSSDPCGSRRGPATCSQQPRPGQLTTTCKHSSKALLHTPGLFRHQAHSLSAHPGWGRSLHQHPLLEDHGYISLRPLAPHFIGTRKAKDLGA